MPGLNQAQRKREPQAPMTDIPHQIAEELGVQPRQVEASVALLDGGATVPFIARYRKEATGGLDDSQLRRLEERLTYLRELASRRETVLKTIRDQGKLTPQLETDIRAADSKTRLEDLYRPYQPKRRTKAQIARELGLEPLADSLLEDPSQAPEALAADYLVPAGPDGKGGVPDAQAALDGARQILMERFAEDAELVGRLREWAWGNARLRSRVIEGKEREGAKFRDYFEHEEPLARIPSHRALALFRGQSEDILQLSLIWEGEDGESPTAEGMIARRFGIRHGDRPADDWLARTVRMSWRVKLSLQLELALKRRLREAAEEEAIRVFGRNLNDLLLAAPAGAVATMGLDPGIRTGVKVAVVDGTGKVVDTATVHPFPPRNDRNGALATLAGLAKRHAVRLVAIGNGTHSRETDALVAELMQAMPELPLTRVTVSEAGASVYSASEYASRELPELDVALRGAVSIARRLQDPLAELVKIEPKAIGVGQYQHDVSQVKLARTLDNVVEDCVNAVGVDVNTASAPLLARVAGLTPALAENVVSHRDRHGPFPDRKTLLEVQRLGPKAYEQCAGFLRIRGGRNPLDASAVHPEAYPVVERILKDSGKSIDQLIGDSPFLQRLEPARYTDDQFGEPTVRDILAELDKPGRDPRPEFRTARFREGVNTLQDLAPGMVLEGTVTNVTNFGAFVDIGVHQDGLVHISALAERFVRDPHEVVKAGDIVKVKVMEVDLERKRIGLSMRLDDEPGEGRSRRGSKPADGAAARRGKGGKDNRPQGGRGARREEKPMGAMAEALAALKKGQ